MSYDERTQYLPLDLYCDKRKQYPLLNFFRTCFMGGFIGYGWSAFFWANLVTSHNNFSRRMGNQILNKQWVGFAFHFPFGAVGAASFTALERMADQRRMVKRG